MPVALRLLRAVAAFLVVASIVRAQEPARTFVLNYASAIDGASGSPQPDVTLMRAGGRIERITKRDVSLAGVQVIDRRDPGGDCDDQVLHVRGEHMIPVAQRMIRRARQLGVRVISGADTQYGPASITRITQEIVNCTELGFAPLETIRAGMSLAAECLGVGARTGRVAAGFEADLIVVEGNPLDDIRIIQDATIVISNGRVALNRLPFGT